MNNSIFTYSEMKERLADYCFGNLMDEENELFVRSLPKYEDLIKEVEEIQSAFPVEKKAQVNDFLASKARNVSVKINERLEKRAVRKRYTLAKYLAPAFGILLLFLVVYEPFNSILTKNDNSLGNKEVSNLIDEVQNPEELIVYVTDVPISGEMDLVPEIQSDEIDEVYEEMIENNLFSEIDDQIDGLNVMNLNEDEMYYILNNLNNNDVELILKELQNEKIVS